MEATTRIEQALEQALADGESPAGPPLLLEAIRYAVFPGGARIRPQLVLAVAQACGDDAPEVTDAALASIELMHCASLVHDDLPCFDSADMRRGKPSVHAAYGERLAVLGGDALIVLAMEVLARGTANSPERLAPLLLTVGQGVGVPSGIIAGQAWECEPKVDLAEYQRAKTGALFAAATMVGAAAAGEDPAPWRALGEKLGEAFQVADDLRDAVSNSEELGKPVGQDEALDRPNAVRQLGVKGATERLKRLLEEAMDSIPACPGEAELRVLLMKQASKFLPKELAQQAA
ncbi:MULTISPECIES: polyprenyl synthetase family protein [Ectothiorhodospira]|jgi:geranylgeranyl diphosphate synthase type II|uniref:Geranylgeranyl diphosphate synthase, type II n=1 Tax=Ectothiorhodospira marina TaxID=1396821 RepID=A0A1H7G1P9_9GAMM|nr:MULTISPECIES: polyprenyl synthetase family protein [Ectothiorhodospira]MCG5515548.1 polyprenyl synthetase family protein [Ectothiorhodospira sp. 9100]MCG5518707.1 polyprenyl synthetase family protein [Ectothiorhodospira sp. 9905]SEK32109.1 geranylgeranyl diphosphate synthase, type II [Ectothiorhodospira marina]